MSIVIVMAASSHAAQFYPGSPTTLIAAINTANSNNQDDVIDLRFKIITLTTANNGQNGLPIILSDAHHSLTIKNGVIQRQAKANIASFRLLDLGDGAVVSLDRVTFKYGRMTTGNLSGGAIYVRAGATLKSVNNAQFLLNAADGNGGAISVAPNGRIGVIKGTTFSSNTAAMGGAIFLSKAVGEEITDSKFSDNYAEIMGGAVAVFNQSVLTRVANTSFISNKSCGSGGALAMVLRSNLGLLSSSTFASNSAPVGGAFLVNGSVVAAISNSTFSSNSGVQGGAINIRNNAIVTTIRNSTFASNTATQGGGAIFISSNSLLARLESTIVATDTAKAGNDVQGFVGYETFNLIGSNDCTNIVVGDPNANNSMVGTRSSPIDPQLRPLKDNGGPTFTRGLGPTSRAINHGSNPQNLDFDQRGKGFPRTLQGQTDIGAYEICRCGNSRHRHDS